MNKCRLTVLVTCFNEAANIGDCLESVKWADEILVIDSFSTDGTLEVARNYTERILQHEYITPASQKNWAIPQARHDWVLILDSDERVTIKLREEIQDLLKKGPGPDGYWIRRRSYLFGKRIYFSGWGRDNVLRLVRRDKARYPPKRVHEKISMSNTSQLTGWLEHYTVTSMEQWVEKLNRYSTWKALDKTEKGVYSPLLHLFFRPPFQFFKDLVFRLGFLDSWRGVLISAMAAFGEVLMSAKLIQIRYEKEEK